MPAISGDIKWETERQGTPGKLTFKVMKDDMLNFTEGDSVTLRVDGAEVFFGFVFSKKRDKEQIISVTAYDQLRYLKNKDTMKFKNTSASDITKNIAGKFNLNVGSIDDTGYIFESRLEDDKTLFDMIQGALDDTLRIQRKMYVLYDDFGKLCLRDIENMKLDILIDEESAENFDYSTSIDNSYNVIKLSYENKETGKREIYLAKDSSHINQWGMLQYFEKKDEQTNGAEKAEALLKLYNRKTRNLSISNVFGDIRVRAGTSVVVNLNLGDMAAMSYMVVEKVTHTFSNDEHKMNLTLRGGDFVA